ncbi:hypothetical protein C8J57DRAFT_1257312 [Mycena rebaudengoi]|nr:hypothetical protein C8J57DRAFT_1257312 [Mycena rebaudengoi]
MTDGGRYDARSTRAPNPTRDTDTTAPCFARARCAQEASRHGTAWRRSAQRQWDKSRGRGRSVRCAQGGAYGGQVTWWAARQKGGGAHPPRSDTAKAGKGGTMGPDAVTEADAVHDDGGRCSTRTTLRSERIAEEHIPRARTQHAGGASGIRLAGSASGIGLAGAGAYGGQARSRVVVVRLGTTKALRAASDSGIRLDTTAPFIARAWTQQRRAGSDSGIGLAGAVYARCGRLHTRPRRGDAPGRGEGFTVRILMHEAVMPPASNPAYRDSKTAVILGPRCRGQPRSSRFRDGAAVAEAQRKIEYALCYLRGRIFGRRMCGSETGRKGERGAVSECSSNGAGQTRKEGDGEKRRKAGAANRGDADAASSRTPKTWYPQ